MPLVPVRDIVWDGGEINLISATYNNLSVSDDANSYSMTSPAGTTITGVIPTRMGRPLWLHNPGFSIVTLSHESSGSDPANRFTCPNGQSVVLGESEAVMLLYSEQDARWIVWPQNPNSGDSGTTFPSSPYAGQSFYRTDLHEEFRYDAGTNLWVGQRTVTVAMGEAGTASTSRIMDGVDGVQHGGDDRGWYFSEHMRLLHFEATWSNVGSFSFQLRRNNSTFRTISPSFTEQIADKDMFVSFAAGGVYAIRLVIGLSSPSNMQVHSTFCRTLPAGQGS